MLNKKIDIKGKQASQQKETEGQSTSSTLGFAYNLGKGIASGLSSLLSDSNNFSSILAREIDQMLSHIRLRYT